MNDINWIQQGWQCPVCKAVMAPHVDICVNCRGVGEIFVTGTAVGSVPEINWSKQQTTTNAQGASWTIAKNTNGCSSYGEYHTKERE